jgi:hypothetical protein
MTDWPELYALSQKKVLQKKKEVESRERFEKIGHGFVELFLNWENIVINNLTIIAKETFTGEWNIYKPYSLDRYSGWPDLEQHEEENRIMETLDREINEQLDGKETVFKWSADSYYESKPGLREEFHYRVEIHFKNFLANKMVVEGCKSHVTKEVNEKKLKTLLLLVYDEGPGRSKRLADMKKEYQRKIIYNLLRNVLPIVLLSAEFLLFLISLILFIRGNTQPAIYVLLICAYISYVNIRTSVLFKNFF